MEFKLIKKNTRLYDITIEAIASFYDYKSRGKLYWHNRFNKSSSNLVGAAILHEEKVVGFIKQQSTFDYKKEISLSEEELNLSNNDDLISNNNDDLYSKAVDIVIKQQKVSTSYIQRYLQIGYNRAARIVEKMEEDGIISEANNAGKRHVLKK